jgi:serine/threonine-protein kinase HipA
MSERELIVLLGGIECGRVVQDRHGRARFVYADSWRRSPSAYPLSLSMPLQAAEHGSARTEAYLWGLLPDNSAILQRWAMRFKVSARNAFALLSQVGEDCAGAVQFVRPERIDALTQGTRSAVEWLTEAQVAERLRALRSDPGATRAPTDLGQFSLAGAQPKTALLFEKGRWGVPSGRTPTTHILKPPTGTFEGFAENEHFCLQLARALGLPSAQSRVLRFGDETAVVIERYDRVRSASGWARIHQEDLCQAMGIPPAKKYPSEGGPGARAIVELLKLHSSAPEEDTQSFLAALGLTWLLAATDGHAKNYSLLVGAGGRVRLAPLYDIASVLPYPRFDLNRVKLAMKIADKYRLRDIGRREWERLAGEVKANADELVGTLIRMAETLPDPIAETARAATAAGLAPAAIERLSAALIAHSRVCLRKLRGRQG